MLSFKHLYFLSRFLTSVDLYDFILTIYKVLTVWFRWSISDWVISWSRRHYLYVTPWIGLLLRWSRSYRGTLVLPAPRACQTTSRHLKHQTEWIIFTQWMVQSSAVIALCQLPCKGISFRVTFTGRTGNCLLVTVLFDYS